MCYTIGIVEERLDFAVNRLVSANFVGFNKVSTNLHIGVAYATGKQESKQGTKKNASVKHR